jgi:hypothetical protein
MNGKNIWINGGFIDLLMEITNKCYVHLFR